MLKTIYIVFLLTLLVHSGIAQKFDEVKPGWFSLGARSTLSSFSRDGSGLGAGGQFRILLGRNVNTEWFADYITINISNKVRSEYYHIGWSVMYYLTDRNFLQPYLVAGHCFDYNKKTVMQDETVSKSRWGSAVQTGLGTHINLSPEFDVSLSVQYMMHLTAELETEVNGNMITITDSHHSALEGHLLVTASLNYKLFRLWRK